MASVTTKIAVEGASKFKADFREAGLAVKATSSELKFLSNELGRTGASEEALANKSSALKSAIEAESNAIKLLQDRLSVLADNGAENSAEAQKWTAELYKHKDAMSSLQTELQETNEAMEAFGSGSSEAKTEVDQLGDQAEQAGNQIGDDFAKDIAIANTVMSELVNSAKKVISAVVDLGKKGIEYGAEMESYSATISAFFRTSGQSASQADKNTQKLIANQKQLSAQIGIGTSALIESNKMLIASGVSGDEAQRAIEGLAKAIVATGGGSEELTRMSANLQQIVGLGKASSADMKQFAMAGVDVYGLMADTTGKSVEELQEMDITFDMIVEALNHATSEGGKFFEAVSAGADTLNGKTSALKGRWDELLGEAMEPTAEILKNEVLPAVTQLIEDVDWQSVATIIAQTVDAFASFVEKVDAFVNWYNDIYGEKPQEVIDGFTTSVEDAGLAFLESGGNVKVFDDAMVNSVENAKNFRQSMQIEMDGFKTDQNTTLQDSAREAKEILVDQGWEMMAQGETNAYQLAEGISNGSISVTSSAKQVADDALKAIDRAKEAEQYGLDFVSGFATGMHRNSGLLATMASKLADIVTEYLHFSKPDKGSLRDYEQWMPDFVSGLARTMEESEWMLADASQDLAQTITNNTVTNNINMTINGSQGQNVSDLADVVMLRIQQATDRRSAVWA